MMENEDIEEENYLSSPSQSELNIHNETDSTQSRKLELYE